VRIWDLSSATCVLTLHGLTAPAQCIALSADGSQLAAMSAGGELCVWKPSRTALLQCIRLSTGQDPGGPSQAPAALQAQGGGSSGSGKAAGSKALAFSPDGARLASSAGSAGAYVWDLQAQPPKRLALDASAWDENGPCIDSFGPCLLWAEDGRSLFAGDTLFDSLTGKRW
jgi:WD40 repeat protein